MLTGQRLAREEFHFLQILLDFFKWWTFLSSTVKTDIFQLFKSNPQPQVLDFFIVWLFTSESASLVCLGMQCLLFWPFSIVVAYSGAGAWLALHFVRSYADFSCLSLRCKQLPRSVPERRDLQGEIHSCVMRPRLVKQNWVLKSILFYNFNLHLYCLDILNVTFHWQK